VPDRTIAVLPSAQTDIDEQTEFLVIRDSAVAVRFLADIAAAFERLIRFPHIGRPWPARSRDLSGVRRLKLSNFPLSVFYRPTPLTIEVLRVLHHSRHLPPDLDDETEL
jgi:plasmid stabilization system protein ParE